MRSLPPDSATWRTDGWTTTDELLATLAEGMSVLNHQLALLRGVKAYQLGKPLRITRPGEDRQRPANVVSIAEFVQRNQKNHAGHHQPAGQEQRG